MLSLGRSLSIILDIAFCAFTTQFRRYRECMMASLWWDIRRGGPLAARPHCKLEVVSGFPILLDFNLAFVGHAFALAWIFFSAVEEKVLFSGSCETPSSEPRHSDVFLFGHSAAGCGLWPHGCNTNEAQDDTSAIWLEAYTLWNFTKSTKDFLLVFLRAHQSWEGQQAPFDIKHLSNHAFQSL